MAILYRPRTVRRRRIDAELLLNLIRPSRFIRPVCGSSGINPLPHLYAHQSERWPAATGTHVYQVVEKLR